MLGLYRSEEAVGSKLKSGFELCREITRRYGTSFYFATQFFPPETRNGIYAVYAFARIPDEIVDDPINRDREEALEKLRAWRDYWLTSMRRGSSEDPVMNAIVVSCRKYGITVEDGEAI